LLSRSRQVLAALSRLRLVIGDDEEELGVGAGPEEALERRLSSSARMILLSSLQTLQTLVDSMGSWEGGPTPKLEKVTEQSPAREKRACKAPCEIREDVAGITVMVYVFLLSRFTEEQRRSLTVPSSRFSSLYTFPWAFCDHFC
jgi:hypothetical protein